MTNVKTAYPKAFKAKPSGVTLERAALIANMWQSNSAAKQAQALLMASMNSGAGMLALAALDSAEACELAESLASIAPGGALILAAAGGGRGSKRQKSAESVDNGDSDISTDTEMNANGPTNAVQAA